MAYDHQVRLRVLLPRTAPVLTEHDAQHAMQAVVDAPMPPHRVRHLLRISVVREEVTLLHAHLPISSARAAHLGHAAQVAPAGALAGLQALRVGAQPSFAQLDSSVPC